MGSTQSKIENKETVNRCKKRKQQMGYAIATRNAFASALSAYAVALKDTGAALSDYAAGEVQHSPNSPGGPSGAGASAAAAAELPIETSPTPEMIEVPKAEGRPVGPTMEEEEDEENDESSNLRQRSSRGAKDIRSGGGGGSSGSGSRKEGVAGNEAPTQRATSPQCTQLEIQERFFPLVENVLAPTSGEVATEEVRVNKRQVESKAFSERPKRAEDDGEVAAPVVSEKALEPPVLAAVEVALAVKGNMSLVDIFTNLDDHFRKASESAHEVLKMLEATRLPCHSNFADNHGHINLSERVMRFITWNRSFRGLPNADGFDSGRNETHATVFDESQAWKLHDEVKVTVDKKQVKSKVFSGRPKRVEDDGEVAASVVSEKPLEPPVLTAAEVALATKSVKKGKADMTPDGKWVVKANISSAQIPLELDDHLQKDPESDHEAKTLEVPKLHHHLNFADNRGSPNADDVRDDFDSGEHETHAMVLATLLGWEKKLYEDVKAGENVKYEYQKKVALNKQRDRGNHSESLDTEAAICKVYAESINSTVSKIKHLRDEQLYPKLIQLVDGMAKMWEAMRICHESQHKTVENLEYLQIDQATKETSEDHHNRTIQLLEVVADWHEQFKNVVDNQKKYVEALKNWLKLNVIPIESSLRDRVSSPPRNDNPLIQNLVHAWEENLEKLPDEPRRTAINKIREDLAAIMRDQEEEMKSKEKCGETRRELDRKSRSLRKWDKKETQHRTSSDDSRIRAKKKVAVDLLQKRLEEEEDAHQKQCLQVREKTLLSFKNRLPELFVALSTFARASLVMYGNLRSLSHPQKQNLSE